MNEDFLLKKVEDLQPALIEAILQIASVLSVKEQAEENAPYGQPIAKTLKATLSLAQNLGFSTYNGKHWGYAQWGESKENDYIGIFGHLDVVEAGVGWQVTQPFQPIIKEGRLYGRGVLDNKGPILACLFALLALKQSGFQPKNPIRIVFGCDEESGFADMKHYLTQQKPPLMGFTPDCKYPVVYGERGRLKLALLAPLQDSSAFFNFVTHYFLQTDNSGNRLGLATTDREFGKLEIKDYRLFTQTHKIGFSFSISYPSCVTADYLIEKIKTLLSKEIELETLLNYNPVKFDKEGFLVQSLLKAYNTVMGEQASPVTTTGGTYAKLVPNIVPFGPSFAGQKGIAHNSDEWFALDDLLTNTKIYALAIRELGK